jgi:hypothetical protein
MRGRWKFMAATMGPLDVFGSHNKAIAHWKFMHGSHNEAIESSQQSLRGH